MGSGPLVRRRTPHLGIARPGQARLGVLGAFRAEVREQAAHLPGVPAAAVRRVAAPLWTETGETPAQLGSIALPRPPGVAEPGRSPVKMHDWDTRKVRCAAHALRREAPGIDHDRSPQVPWNTD
ncbi:hypothetical protein ACFW4O_10095 [Streptomyces mutabilis]|uniref:hypothetical protein n=1 Tax=Streptomyces mutabilis TaxID=67332 RepID=UPI00369D277D